MNLDSDLIKDCEIIARSAYRRSLIITAIIVAVFILFAIDWYLYGSNPLLNSGWNGELIFAIKTLIIFTLCIFTLFRLGGYLTYSRFIDTMAKKKPVSVFMALKRHRDSLEMEDNSRRQQAKDDKAAKAADLEARVKAALER